MPEVETHACILACVSVVVMTKDEAWLLEEKYGGDASAPAFAADMRRLAAGEPLAYIIGVQPFLGLQISLDSHPLIPRVETEWWTEKLVQSLQEQEAAPLKFLDLCAGSGAIGCAALSRLEHARVFFGEIDPAHESTIRKNIAANGLDIGRADIRMGDLFEPFSGLRFDVIAANPPYVPAGRVLPTSVTAYEPPRALYAGEDGLELIKRLATLLPHHLAPDGIAWIECDSAHARLARELFERAGLAASVRPDQYGSPRIIVVARQ